MDKIKGEEVSIAVYTYQFPAWRLDGFDKFVASKIDGCDCWYTDGRYYVKIASKPGDFFYMTSLMQANLARLYNEFVDMNAKKEQKAYYATFDNFGKILSFGFGHHEDVQIVYGVTHVVLISKRQYELLQACGGDIDMGVASLFTVAEKVKSLLDFRKERKEPKIIAETRKYYE